MNTRGPSRFLIWSLNNIPDKQKKTMSKLCSSDEVEGVGAVGPRGEARPSIVVGAQNSGISFVIKVRKQG